MLCRVLQEKAPVAEQFNLDKAKLNYLKSIQYAGKSLKRLSSHKPRLSIITTLAASYLIFIVFFSASEAYEFNIF